MKHFYRFLLISLILIAGINIGSLAQVVYYVGDGGLWENWDIYSYNIQTGIETRLTTDPGIDNHPVISHYDTTRVAFSSNRDNGEFEIYVADVGDIDGTAVRLTFDNHPPPNVMGAYPDRHPHWHPNGELIIYTCKNREVLVPDTLATECSQPFIIYIVNGIRYRLFEGMNILEIDETGTVLDYIELDIRDAWDGSRAIWRDDLSVYVGHP